MPDKQDNGSTPPPPSWLNRDLIQLALQKGENDPSLIVLSCDISAASSVSNGYLSNMYRAVAKLQANEERHLVIKCQPQGGKQEEFVNDLSAYEKETKMFTETLPAMQKLLAKIGVYQPLSAKCFYHGNEPVPFIILEDLRWSGFTLADRIQGLDMNHCKLVIKSHALFHASSAALYEQDPSALDFYNQSPFDETIKKFLGPFIETSAKTLEENVKTWPGYERFSEKLTLVRKYLLDRLILDSQRKQGRFNTLLHGDTWTNNFMFNYNNGIPEDVRLLDFQLCYRSSPTIDLQTFTTTCSQEEVRDNLDVLLKEYHDILTATLEKLHCKTRAFTFEEMKRDFDEHSSFGIWASCAGLPFVMSHKTQNMKLDDLIDNNTEDVNYAEEANESEVYQRIMKKLLIKYEKLGAL